MHTKNAQALVFTVISILVLICFIAFVINAGEVISWKIKMQNCADASALSGAIWQARGLNIIAVLNDGIIGCEVAIVGMVAAIGVSEGALIPVLVPKIVKMYKIARKMAKLQDIIKKTNPVLVEGEVLRIARLNGIGGAVAVAPGIIFWPELHIHRLGQFKTVNPQVRWKEGDDIVRYRPSKNISNTLIPTPYIRDKDFADKQYVFCIAFDRPREIIAPGRKIFGVKNPALFHIPEITIAGNRLGGDVGYITTAQARPVNRYEPAPLLQIPQWDVELTAVTAPGNISIPGISKIAKILQEELICH